MENPILIATLFMVVLLLGGVHVCVALGLGTLLGFWLGDLPLSFFVERCYTNFESVPLLAVPFFLLVGEIMGRGTMAAGLLRFCRACCGHMKGAMVWVTVFTNLIFGALCGSPVAALVAVGGIMMPALEEDGYSKEFAATLCAGSCMLSAMIPPSVPLILYGSLTGTSVTQLFVSSIVPGFFTAALLIAFGLCYVFIFKVGRPSPRVPYRERLKILWEIKWALGMPVIIMGTIYTGVCTPTEAGALAVVYCLFVETCISRVMTVRLLWDICKNAMVSLGMFIIIMMVAQAFGSLLTMFDMQGELYTFLHDFTNSRIILMTLLAVLFLIAGCFVDGSVLLLVLTPLLAPVCQRYGISPIQLGVFMLFGMNLGNLTPPVGMMIYLAASVNGCSLAGAFRAAGPLLIFLFFGLLVVGYVPWLSECLL